MKVKEPIPEEYDRFREGGRTAGGGLEPGEARRRAEEIIAPGGELGTPGKRRGMFTRPGGRQVAEETFERLKALGAPINRPQRSYPGEEVEIPGIGPVGYRSESVYRGQEPTIDVNVTINGVRVRKLKFEE